ncbi:MAG: copper-binding protein [Pseudomonadota bacterium]
MKYITLNGLLAILFALSTPAFAAESMTGMKHAEIKHMQHTGTQATQGHQAEGVLNSIDLQNRKINLTHGPVKSLGWPGMTMNFSFKDAAILKGIQPGQKVAFEIVKEAPKKFYVSKITALK